MYHLLGCVRVRGVLSVTDSAVGLEHVTAQTLYFNN